jgi:hypothetical protein
MQLTAERFLRPAAAVIVSAAAVGRPVLLFRVCIMEGEEDGDGDAAAAAGLSEVRSDERRVQRDDEQVVLDLLLDGRLGRRTRQEQRKRGGGRQRLGRKEGRSQGMQRRLRAHRGERRKGSKTRCRLLHHDAVSRRLGLGRTDRRLCDAAAAHRCLLLAMTRRVLLHQRWIRNDEAMREMSRGLL